STIQQRKELVNNVSNVEFNNWLNDFQKGWIHDIKKKIKQKKNLDVEYIFCYKRHSTTKYSKVGKIDWVIENHPSKSYLDKSYSDDGVEVVFGKVGNDKDD
ncbi:MAG: hypothetical protein EBY16_09635, partial [Gammaproteobacteria bacterium]|nr:hypothetical protein [Gammaproteobacteria bacterium]